MMRCRLSYFEKIRRRIKYICELCRYSRVVSVLDFDIITLGGEERGIGNENIDSLEMIFVCLECDNHILLVFVVSEHPAEVLNHAQDNSSGAIT